MTGRALLVSLFALAGAPVAADSTVPAPAPPAPVPVKEPQCRDVTWRGVERAFAAYCKKNPGGGIHGTCAEWLRAYRRCDAAVFEPAPPGWNVVVKLFDCHDPLLTVVPDGKGWRVDKVTMRSYLPMPRVPDLSKDGDLGGSLE